MLTSMQNGYCRSDMRRERVVSLCRDVDVRRLTSGIARPMAPLRIGAKILAHLTGLVRPEYV